MTFYLLIILGVLFFSFLPSFHISASPLLLTCGTDSGGTDTDGRKWEPDAKYLIAGADKSAAAKAEVQDPSLPSDVPYMSARIFHSGSTYQFSLQNPSSHTLLRLHFYPSSYPNVDVSKSYFGVAAGSMVLLNNFSAYITAQALSQSYLVKEYYLTPSRSPFLNVTFRPADKSFAFVNGVEVIAAPEIFNAEPLLVGSYVDARTFSTIPVGASSMETMYRLNVGGQFIPPLSDSGGLMRTWYDDSVYIHGAGQGVAVTANVSIGYKKLAPYTAPLDVYRSYRSMGAYVDVNKVSNLTWIFEIDPGFLYIVRLHWCDSEMVKVNQRVFDVIINNMTAAHEVDLFALTDAIATPVVKDYVVVTENVTDGGYRLWVSLAPTNGSRPQFMDVLLNGLEIFKMSDNFETNLAAPNPRISDLMRKGHKMEPKGFEEDYFTIIITCGAGGAAAVGVAVAVICALYRRTRRAGSNGDSRTSWLPISRNSNTTKSSSVVAISTDAASNCRYFSLVEITTATNNFDESNIIGVGGFGKSTNILLDDKWEAKVSDFGLSKTGPTVNKGHVSTAVKGSFGYLDPEYFSRQQLSEKSDVYSFGVVLFEVLCARPALCPDLPQEQIGLAGWAPRNVRLGKLEEIIDPELIKGRISLDSVAKFTDVAERCLADHGGDRPTMGDVLRSLEMALQLQQKYMAGGDDSTISQQIPRDVEESRPNHHENNDPTFSLYVNEQGR
ncbi:non-specific serine/threonine protein kinase [Salvia divinorum]|uniref:Non-specific serine/threonine protein kinase n=1 Tax=Salvia divinorum TaxID=28513 RepID=A0ABD1HQ07_SALDI